MAKKRVFSGIQPSGDLHIGNYLATIHKWVQEQDEKENVFCVVDQHAITVPQDPRELSRRTIEIAKIYLAAGIDPAKSTIFVQSSRPEHSELAWILNCFTYFGEASRMTQFKDKSGKNENVTVGLFDYPVLMAADILLYDTDEVPVGDDQKQHVELTRDVAERINKRFGKDILRIPAFTTNKAATRIMSLTDPTIKMSKSDENENSRIEILDSPEIIRKKFARAVTDSDTEIKYYKENKPGVSNLLNIMAVCSGQSLPELTKKYSGVSYGDFKKDVAEAVIELLAPFQKRFSEISDEEVRKVLIDGAENVAPKAQETLKRVKKAIGLGI